MHARARCRHALPKVCRGRMPWRRRSTLPTPRPAAPAATPQDETNTPIKQDTKKGKLRFYPYNINWNYGLLPQVGPPRGRAGRQAQRAGAPRCGRRLPPHGGHPVMASRCLPIAASPPRLWPCAADLGGPLPQERRVRRCGGSPMLPPAASCVCLLACASRCLCCDCPAPCALACNVCTRCTELLPGPGGAICRQSRTRATAGRAPMKSTPFTHTHSSDQTVTDHYGILQS